MRERSGFIRNGVSFEVGCQNFVLGSDVQNDLIMERSVESGEITCSFMCGRYSQNPISERTIAEVFQLKAIPELSPSLQYCPDSKRVHGAGLLPEQS